MQKKKKTKKTKKTVKPKKVNKIAEMLKEHAEARTNNFIKMQSILTLLYESNLQGTPEYLELLNQLEKYEDLELHIDKKFRGI